MEISLKELNDAQLVEACQASLPVDMRAYHELVNRFWPYAYSCAYRMVSNHHEAEEIAQEAMLRVFHKIQMFEGRSSFSTWLYKIVLNEVRRRISKSKTKQKTENRLSEEINIQEQTSITQPSADNRIDRVQDALKKLKPDQRELITMRYVSGLKLEEMAETLQIELSAAKMRLYRAMEAFKKAHQNIDNFEGTRTPPGKKMA